MKKEAGRKGNGGHGVAVNTADVSSVSWPKLAKTHVNPL